MTDNHERRADARDAERQPPLLHPDALRALGIDTMAGADAAFALLAALHELVRARWPADAGRWPLLSSRFAVRTCVLARAVPHENVPGRSTLHPTGSVLLALDALPGPGAQVVDGPRWVVVKPPVRVADEDAHERLRRFADVRDDGAALLLPLEVMQRADGTWTARPEMAKQIEWNALRHRRLLDCTDDAAFPQVDWRNLTDDERQLRLLHVLGLVRQAEAARRDPPSWRELARQAGTSVKTLRDFEDLVAAVADAEQTAQARHRESLHRHAAAPEADRRAG